MIEDEYKSERSHFFRLLQHEHGRYVRMKSFLDDNFLLNNKTAESLYHCYAKNLPIIDYHCHLSSKEIAENKKFDNLTDLWLRWDHYKWRAMRINGVDEKYITGNASDKEKFLKWAETIPRCIGNPLYHWTHLELQRYFGIKTLLSPQSAEEIWTKCNKMLKGNDFSARSLIKRSNVVALCTTDDPLDSLEYHASIAKDHKFGVRVLPAFRPDKALNIEYAGFVKWLEILSEVSGFEIRTIDGMKKALLQRINFFNSAGCRISDHGIDQFAFLNSDENEVNTIFKKALTGKTLKEEDIIKYKTHMLLFLGKEYALKKWVMQIHIGAIRDVNKKMYSILGSDSGFDSIGDEVFIKSLAQALNELNLAGGLPRTIIYCINPRDNDAVGALTGCFQGDKIPGKIQFGSAWWFNDQRDGIRTHLKTLANLGLLSRFIGMTTDSRSFVSYTRHEYFRRILCNILGKWVEDGKAPKDLNLLGNMVQDICFENARNYFGIL